MMSQNENPVPVYFTVFSFQSHRTHCSYFIQPFGQFLFGAFVQFCRRIFVEQHHSARFQDIFQREPVLVRLRNEIGTRGAVGASFEICGGLDIADHFERAFRFAFFVRAFVDCHAVVAVIGYMIFLFVLFCR